MKYILILLGITFICICSYAIDKKDTIQINSDIRLIEICDNFYVHESFTFSSQYGRFSSNGMLVVKNGKALMIDTPYTNEEAEAIYNFLKDSMQITITTFIGGHYHNDCIGGMEYLKSKGVKTILSDQTKSFCAQLDFPLPDTTFTKSLKSNFEHIEFECNYLGGGHSADNIVVYFPKEKVLFGGCLIKAAESKNIGNTADAVVNEWMATVEKVMKQYPKVEVVIPGHGNYGNARLLTHTIDIVENYIQNNLNK